MERIKLSFIFNVLFLLSSSSVANAETIQVREALVQFMQKLSPGNNQAQPNWGWNASSDPCIDTWKGVICYNNSQTVKKIVLEELNFTGVLDVSSLCITKALIVLSLNSNNLVGTFPGEISSCTHLTHIYLHRNNFSGDLPRSLSRLGNLKRIDISNNGFTGNIPDVSRIFGLLTFLAENNHLSGGIPNFDFSNLEDFNVSNNNLSGQVPDVEGHFSQTSFLNNPELCGTPLANACPPRKKRGSGSYFMYFGYAGIGLVILCLIAITLIKKRKKSKNILKELSSITSSESKNGNRSEYSITDVESGKGSSSSLVVMSSPVVNGLRFEDLLRSPAELIGRSKRGSVFKVTLNEGLVLVVKRIKDWDISKDDFEKRMWRIDQVKHPNVMPIVAFYCSKQEKLLVYEFQQNGSLFGLLHGSQTGQSFDWKSRLNIASKICNTLAFMHESLQGDGIPHGNLKSSNILLDTEMEPILSEYGLAEVDYNRDQTSLSQNESSTAKSSPESIFNKNGFNLDIYNFGVILLELLTGKLVQSNGFDLSEWVNSAINGERTAEVFNKVLVFEGANEERMVNLLMVARKCVNYSEEARPGMREVAVMINSIMEYEEKSTSSGYES